MRAEGGADGPHQQGGNGGVRADPEKRDVVQGFHAASGLLSNTGAPHGSGARRRTLPRPDSGERLKQRVFRALGVIPGLSAQPITLCKPEEPAQPEVGVGGDGAPPRDDLTDPLGRNTNLLRQPVLGDAHRLEKFFPQNFSGGDGFQFLRHRCFPLVVVHDLDMFRAFPPAKSNVMRD